MSHQPRKIPKLASGLSKIPHSKSGRRQLTVGDKVVIAGERIGYLRFCGNTEFADGIWCGVELLDGSGKHDGQLNGVRYFLCAANHGVFAAASKVCLHIDSSSTDSSSPEKYHKVVRRHYPALAETTNVQPSTSQSISPSLKFDRLDSRICHSSPLISTDRCMSNIPSPLSSVRKRNSLMGGLTRPGQRSIKSAGANTELCTATVMAEHTTPMDTTYGAQPRQCADCFNQTFDQNSIGEPRLNETFDGGARVEGVRHSNSVVNTTFKMVADDSPSKHELSASGPPDENRCSVDPAVLKNKANETFDCSPAVNRTFDCSPAVNSTFDCSPAVNKTFDCNPALNATFDRVTTVNLDSNNGKGNGFNDLEAEPTFANTCVSPSIDNSTTSKSNTPCVWTPPTIRGRAHVDPQYDVFAMSTPLQMGSSGEDFLFDEEEMAREADKVLMALNEINRDMSAESDSILPLNDSSSDTFGSQQQHKECSIQQTDMSAVNESVLPLHSVSVDVFSPKQPNVEHTDANEDVNGPQLLEETTPVAHTVSNSSIQLDVTQTLESGADRLDSTHTINSTMNRMDSTHTINSSPGELETTHSIINSSPGQLETTHTVDSSPSQLKTTQSIMNSTQTIMADNVADVKTDIDNGTADDTRTLCVNGECSGQVNQGDVDVSTAVEDVGGIQLNGGINESMVTSVEESAADVTDSSSPSTGVKLVNGNSSPHPSVAIQDTEMQVDQSEVKNSVKPLPKPSSLKSRKPLPSKSGIPDRRQSLPVSTSRPSRLHKPRESLLPPPKIKEKTEAPPKPVIQKSKPKSKWADISKQIEQNAKTPAKPVTRNVQSKLNISELDLASLDNEADTTSRRTVERTASISSDQSQTSASSRTQDPAKKPLKRQSILPPSTSAGAKQEFKKPRASLLPPPSSGKGLASKAKLKDGKGSKAGLATQSGPTSAAPLTTPTSQQNGVTPPVSIVSPQKVKPGSQISSRVTRGSAPQADKAKSKAISELQTQLEEVLRLSESKDVYSKGLNTELTSAGRKVEGLSIVIQQLSHIIEQQRQELERKEQSERLMVKSQEEQLQSHRNEIELMSRSHELEKQAIVERLTDEKENEVSRLLTAHTEDMERVRQQLSDEHSHNIDSLLTQHSAHTTSLNEEIGRLKSECVCWQVKFVEATDALHKDMDHRLQVALQPYTDLPKEIESLKTVIELKSNENKELRIENNQHRQKVETIPDLEKKLYDTKQKLENVQALLDIVSAKEKETAEKYHQITRKAVQEKKENHRLSLNVEALELKLEEVEFSQSFHLDTVNGNDLETSTMSLPAYSIDSPDMSPSQFTRSFSRSSGKRRSKRGSSSNNNNSSMEIPEMERQISPAKHLVLRSPSSSPSPTRLTSPRKPPSSGLLPTSPNSKAATLPKSYKSTKRSQEL